MTVKIFRNEKFETTHENIIFDEMISLLENQWANSKDLVILLGNFYTNGTQIDAVIVKKDSISVIDFKNYGGKISFSENGSWYAGGKEIVMEGRINPYLQIKNAKFKFIDKLTHNEIGNYANNQNLGHVSGIVLFHQPIEINIHSIPPRLGWFHITDILNVVRLLDNITSDRITLSNTEILNIPKMFDLKEYKFSSPKITIEEEKFINRDLLISELFKLMDILKSIEIARKEGEKFIKTHNEFIKYFQNAYLSEKCVLYHISHFQKNYESKREDFILNQKKALNQQIDSIYNLNTINGYVFDEFTNEKKLKEFLLNIANTRKLIDNLVKKYNHTISSQNLNIQSYKAYFNFFYEQGIFDRRPLLFIKNEIEKKEKLINLFHGLYVILKTWFGSDMILQLEIHSKIVSKESKDYYNNKTRTYLISWLESPEDFPPEDIECEIITIQEETYSSIQEYKFARGISGRWYSKMMKKFAEKEELEFYENEFYTITIDGKVEERKLIAKVKLPQKLISLFKELRSDISNILTKEEIDELFDLMDLKWVGEEWIDIRDIHLMDLKTHYIYSNAENLDFLMNSVSKYQYSGCFEPFYLTCLEYIGNWGLSDFKIKPDVYLKTYQIFDKYNLLIDDLPDYFSLLPPYDLNYYRGQNGRFDYPFSLKKTLLNVSEECNVSTENLISFLCSIDDTYHKKLWREADKINAKPVYPILLKKFKNLPTDVIIDKIPKKPITKNEMSLVGYEDIKEFIEDSLEQYKNPELAKKYGLTIETSMILYGPPGCGKTAWADQIARLLDLKLEKIPRSEFGSTYVDGAMLALTKRLDEIEKRAPIAVFFDEFDSVAPKREAQSESNDEGKKVVNTLLQRIQDLLGKGVVVLAATNFIGDLDSAVIRPGRFNLHIPIFPPLPRERIEIILHYLNGDNAEAIIQVLSNSYADTNDFWIEYVESMDLFSNSHVISFCDKLKNHVFKQSKENSIDEIYFTDEVIIKALNLVKSQIRKADIEIYKKFHSDSENLTELFKERMQRLKYEIDKLDNPPGKGRTKVGFKTQE
ncbi:MAG: AAA family ATPase [Prolixibacteraceae bacterium]|jgi:hypothetical protein|nr:AAA family ATPase [Prolixibacteraceae bacterium]